MSESIYLVETETEYKAFRSIESARSYVMEYFINNMEDWYSDEVKNPTSIIKDDLKAIFSAEPHIPNSVYFTEVEVED